MRILACRPSEQGELGSAPLAQPDAIELLAWRRLQEGSAVRTSDEAAVTTRDDRGIILYSATASQADVNNKGLLAVQISIRSAADFSVSRKHEKSGTGCRCQL